MKASRRLIKAFLTLSFTNTTMNSQTTHTITFISVVSKISLKRTVNKPESFRIIVAQVATKQDRFWNCVVNAAIFYIILYIKALKWLCEFYLCLKKIKIYLIINCTLWMYLCCVKFMLRLLVTKLTYYLTVFTALRDTVWKTEKDFLFKCILRKHTEYQVWIKMNPVHLVLWFFL